MDLRSEVVELERRLQRLKVEMQRQEQERFVVVQFHGNSRRYTYELAPGHRARTGDYVAVYSPWTDQTELVRVVAQGRGTWTGRVKIARSVNWSVRSDVGQHGGRLIECEEDLFPGTDIGG